MLCEVSKASHFLRSSEITSLYSYGNPAYGCIILLQYKHAIQASLAIEAQQ